MSERELLRALLRRRLPRDLTLRVALLLALATAAYMILHLILRLPPRPVQSLLLSTPGTLDAPPRWRTDIYGPPSSPLRNPLGVAASPDGRIFVADTGNARIQVFSREGRWLYRFGRYGQRPGEFDYPTDVIYSSGRLYVADLKNSRIQVFTPEGRLLDVWPDPKRERNLRFAPTALAADGAGRIYAATVNHEVLVFDRSGRLLGRLGRGGTEAGELSYPNGVAPLTGGRIWVADTANGRLQLLDRGGRPLAQVEGFAAPRGMSHFRGRLFVAEPLQHRIQVLDSRGNPLYTFGERGTRGGTFNFPSDVEVDRLGTVYVADRENDRISVWSYW